MPWAGLEPATHGASDRRSTLELPRHKLAEGGGIEPPLRNQPQTTVFETATIPFCQPSVNWRSIRDLNSFFPRDRRILLTLTLIEQILYRRKPPIPMEVSK